MEVKAIVAGAVLVALGILVTVASDSSSATSLIPAIVGVLFVVIGVAARARPGVSHHLMHAAAGLALLAALGSLGSAIGRGSEGWALFAQLGTAVIAGAFLLQAIASFRSARRARAAESSGT